MENLSGRMVQGYDLLERIGAGGFGAVYRAYQSTVGREVAVKVILPAYANKPEFIRRFEIEAQLVARLEHLHIVPLYDYWRDPDGAYIVMRWLRGGSLSAALQNGAFELEPASLLLGQVAAGLASAHYQQIVHRDLKPSNILLDEEGNAYLADFGIARDLRRANGADGVSNGRTRLDSRSEGQILGSSQYLSPEQLRGQAVTPQSDIYSLGITLYKVVSGQHPFPGLNSVQQLYKHIDEPLPRIDLLDPGVSDGVNEVIQKATAKNPKHRFQDALAMAAAFRTSARLNRDGQTADLVESLTRREQEILHLIIEGNTNQQIAQALFLELSTVKWHINRIYKKLGVRSRVQAIVRARDLNLILSTNETELEPAQKTSVSVVLPEPANPYKGLRAFEPADNRDFFGRETVVERLLSRLTPANASSPRRSALDLITNGSERFLAIVGPSGSGKSSLIKAGLIPALWSGQLASSEKWFIVDMLPGARPLEDLEIALMRIAADQAGNLREHMDRDSRGLARAAKLILPNDESELVVVIDQFEELYILVEDEAARSRFMDLIQAAVTDPRSRVRVVIALRADYYDRPLEYPAFGELVRGHLETLLPMTAEELERAIVNPARQAGVTFEPGLVATIIEDVNYRPGALPLLQFALAELFEKREGRLLTQNAYLAFGGAAGALARRAEELYQEQGAEGREAIRQMFLRLVSVADQMTGAASDVPAPADTRKRVLRSELLSAAGDPERLDEIIDTYANYRLLSLDHHSATRRATVEVAHEAILREWERLRSWLEESRVDLSLHRQLIRATGEWIEAGGDQSFILRGTRLARFESWADDSQIVLTADERSYLKTSIERREEKAAAERERQEQEARLERQSNRRLKSLLAVMAVAVVVAVGLAAAAVSFARQAEEQRTFAEEQQTFAEEQQTFAEEQQTFAEEQQTIAEEQQRLAEVRALAAAALANLETDPERSILLALEAAETTLEIDGNVLPEVEDALHRAVQADRIQLTIPLAGALAFSPNGNMLAIGDDDGNVTLWDATTGQRHDSLNGHGDLISDLAFSPDGQHLVSASLDSRVSLWSLLSGQMVARIRHQFPVNVVAISPDSRLLASATNDGQVQTWDMGPAIVESSENSGIYRLKEPSLVLKTPWGASGLAFSPDGLHLAAFVPGSSVIIWDAFTGEKVSEISGTTAFSSGLEFSLDGRLLAFPMNDTGIMIWDLTSGVEALILHEALPIADISFSQDSSTLAVATKDGTVTLWDTETGQQMLKLVGRSSGYNFIALHPDGKRLATGGEDGMTRIWDLGPGDSSELFTVAAHIGTVHDAIYSPDGTQIVTAGADGQVKLWDAMTGRLLHTLPGQVYWVHFPAFSPDGQRLAATNRNGGITIWDPKSGREQITLAGDSTSLTAVTFSPDGQQLAASGEEGVVTIWDATTGERLINFNHDSGIMRLVYNLDGKLIWSFDRDGWAISWDLNSGERVSSNFSQSREVCDTVLWDAELNSDGRYWAAAGFDGLAHVYATKDEQDFLHPYSEGNYFRVYSIEGHVGNVTGVTFHPDNPMLATSGFDGTVRLWDLESGEELLKLTGHRQSAQGVDFSPDGRHLVSAGADGTIRVNIISIEELMEVARSRLSRDFTLEECRNYLNLARCRNR